MTIHRGLAICSFIIFLCPFFQMCSDKKIIEEPILGGSPLHRIVSRTETIEDRKQIIHKFLEARRNMTFNGYEIGFRYFTDFSVMQLFIIPIVINLLIFFFAIKDKISKMFYLSVLNIIFCLSWIICMWFLDYLEDIKQIKFGFYLHLLNLILIGYISKSHTNKVLHQEA